MARTESTFAIRALGGTAYSESIGLRPRSTGRRTQSASTAATHWHAHNRTTGAARDDPGKTNDDAFSAKATLKEGQGHAGGGMLHGPTGMRAHASAFHNSSSSGNPSHGNDPKASGPAMKAEPSAAAARGSMCPDHAGMPATPAATGTSNSRQPQAVQSPAVQPPAVQGASDAADGNIRAGGNQEATITSAVAKRPMVPRLASAFAKGAAAAGVLLQPARAMTVADVAFMATARARGHDPSEESIESAQQSALKRHMASIRRRILAAHRVGPANAAHPV